MIIDNSDVYAEITQTLPDALEKLNEECIRDGFSDVQGKRFCWSSNKIEGNTLSLEETVELIDFDCVRANHTYSEYREAMNLYKAIRVYLFPMQLREISIEFLLDANHLITEIPKGFRTKQVYVGTLTEAVYYPPNPEDINSLMTKLLAKQCFKMGEVATILEFISKFHINFERIHPFLDGNGRTGRLILNQQLINYGMLPISIEKNSDYRQAFRLFDKNGNSSKMERVIAKAELEAIKIVQELTKTKDGKRIKNVITRDISAF